MGETIPTDVGNDFLIGRRGARVVFIRHVPHEISTSEARRMAAWLVAMTENDDDGPSFEQVLAAVRST